MKQPQTPEDSFDLTPDTLLQSSSAALIVLFEDERLPLH